MKTKLLGLFILATLVTMSIPMVNYVAPTKAQEVTVEPGGQVTLPMGEEPSILNPFSPDTTAYDWAILGLIFEGPYTAHPLDPFNFEKDFPIWLAEMPIKTYETHPEYGNITVITLKIKQGVKFHDGVEMTADDVIFSYDFAYWLYQETGGEAEYYYLFIYGQLFDWEKVDDYTVKLYLKTNAWLPYYYAFMEVFPKHIYEKATTWGGTTGTFPDWDVTGYMVMNYEPKSPADPILTGTGPFKLSYWNGPSPSTSSEFVMVRNPDYHLGAIDAEGNIIHPWKDPNEEFEPYGPYVDSLKYVVIKETSVLVQALKAGEIDYSSEYELAAYVTELQAAGFEIATTPRLGFGHLSFNTKMTGAPATDTSFKAELMRNPIFRKAIAFAVDKNRVVSEVWKGYAIPIDSPIPPSMNVAYNWSIEEMMAEHFYDANPTKAREILENELGLVDADGDGFYDDPETGGPITLDFWATAVPVVEAIATIIADSIEAAGIAVKLHLVDFTELISTLFEGTHDLAFFGFILGRLPTFVLAFASFSVYARLVWYFKNDTVDDLVLKIIFEDTTIDEVLQDIHQLQYILIEQLPLTPIYQNKIVSAYRTDKWAGYINLYGTGVDNYWTLMKLIKVVEKEEVKYVGPTPPAPPTGPSLFLIGGGILVAVVVLTALYSLFTATRMARRDFLFFNF